MHVTLIESGRKPGRGLFGSSVPSLLIHAAIISGAILATLHGSRGPARTAIDTTLVLLAPTAPRPVPPPRPALTLAVKGFQTVSIPALVPAVIPAVSLQEHFDPKDFAGVGVEGGRADGVAAPDPDQVYDESAVDEPPLLLAAPPAQYPPLLRDAGVTGRVLLQAVLDTTGRVDPATVRIVESPNPAFEVPSRRWILHAQFRPARIRGLAVRVLVNVPLDFSIATRGGT